MTPTADLILERRRIRRRLTLWRVVAILAILVAVALALPPLKGGTGSDHIARISIDGIITEDAARDRKIAEIAQNFAAKALIVRIDSPGGTVVGSEALYEGLRAVAAADKPVIAVMSEVAASGGYITALAADHVVARGNTLTGSIGVIAEIPNIAGLLETVGIEVNRFKSAPLKAEPSLTSRPTPEGIAAEQALIADTFVWFKALVAERRKLDGARLDQVSDGRAFTGRQALTLGLIDALGDEQTARTWLDANHQLGPYMTVIDYDWTDPEVPWPLSEFTSLLPDWLPQSGMIGTGPRLYALMQ